MEFWRIARVAAWVCLICVVLVIAFAENVGFGYIFLAAFILLMIISGIEKSKDPYVKRAKEEKKIQRKARNDIGNRKRVLDNAPVAAELIWTDEYVRKPGSFGGAVIGGLMGGPAGVAVGAYLCKKKSMFAVRYASGRTGTETVDIKSARFEKLSALTK